MLLSLHVGLFLPVFQTFVPECIAWVQFAADRRHQAQVFSCCFVHVPCHEDFASFLPSSSTGPFFVSVINHFLGFGSTPIRLNACHCWAKTVMESASAVLVSATLQAEQIVDSALLLPDTVILAHLPSSSKDPSMTCVHYSPTTAINVLPGFHNVSE